MDRRRLEVTSLMTVNMLLIGAAIISILMPNSVSEARRHAPPKIEEGIETEHAPWYKNSFLLVEDGLTKSREKRATPGTPLPFSAEEETNLVNLHNNYRRLVSPPASNMEYMIWDAELAAWAQEWSDGCYYEHGFPPAAINVRVGQNLWRGLVHEQPDGSGPISSWWDEWQWYDYETDSCQPGKICTHYTQLVWDTSSKVGCGRSFCAEGYDDTLNFTTNYIVACNYLEQGNKDVKPYENGTSCTRCTSGVMHCDNKLCRICQEEETVSECLTTCEVNCRNCGVANDDCTCTCTPQFTGVDCSAPCGDYNANCGTGLPQFLCSGVIPGFEFVLEQCPAMCGLCSVEPDTLITGCPTAIQRILNTDSLTNDRFTIVTWIEPISSLTSVVITSQSHVPGTRFPVGQTSVQYVFSSDTQEIAATCCFDVEVIFRLVCSNTTVASDFGDVRLPASEVGTTIDSMELCPDILIPIIHAVCQLGSNDTASWDIDIKCPTEGTTTGGTTTEGTSARGTTTGGNVTEGTSAKGTTTGGTTVDGTSAKGTTAGGTTTEGTTATGTTTGGKTTVGTSAKGGTVTEGTSAKGTTPGGTTTEGTTATGTTTGGKTTVGTSAKGGTTTEGTSEKGTTPGGTTTEGTTTEVTTTEGTIIEGNMTRSLAGILKTGISGDNLSNISRAVFLITEENEDITVSDIGLLVDILQQISYLNSTDANVTDDIVGIVNNLMNAEKEILTYAQRKGNFTTAIVQIMESQLNTVDVHNGSFDTSYTNIVAKVLDVPSENVLDGLVVTMFTKNTEDLSSSSIKVGTHQDTPTETIAEDTFARVVVPIEAAQILTVPKTTVGSASSASQPHGSVVSDLLRIVFLVYIDDVMFPSPTLAQLNQESEDFNRTVNTPVVSLAIGGRKIEDLTEPINITFSRLMTRSRNPTCNFWEYSLGKWSRTGCELLPDDSMSNSMAVDDIEDEYYTCSCDHLTNFAVLVDIYAMDEPPKALLRVSSIVGCTISCVCLLITLISYLSIKRVRSTQTHRIFICLCVTLLCLYTTFLVIVALDTEFQHAEVELVPCTVLAALIHYFVLSSITWMGIEGFHTYLVIIRVFDTYIPRFMIKAAMVGWGIPAVIVGLTGGIARNSYAVEDYCFIQKWSLIGGLLVPMAIILLVDIVIFILAMRHLKQSARKEGRVNKGYMDQRQETLERIQNGISMLIMLGFTLITGYLTLIHVDIAIINTLFIISTSLLGFFIFVMYCLRMATIREQLRLSCGFFSEDQNTKFQRSSGQTPMNTNGTTGTSTSSEDSSSVHYSNPSYAY